MGFAVGTFTGVLAFAEDEGICEGADTGGDARNMLDRSYDRRYG